MRGASPPPETDQAHIVKETQRDADDLTGSVRRSTPFSSASASIEALTAAMRMESQARSNEGNSDDAAIRRYRFIFQIQMYHSGLGVKSFLQNEKAGEWFLWRGPPLL